MFKFSATNEKDIYIYNCNQNGTHNWQLCTYNLGVLAGWAQALGGWQMVWDIAAGHECIDDVVGPMWLDIHWAR